MSPVKSLWIVVLAGLRIGPFDLAALIAS